MKGSWIIVKKETGVAVLETFNEKVTAAINTEKYQVLTALEYLCLLNKKLKDANNNGRH